MFRLACLVIAWVIAWPPQADSTLAPEKIYAQELVNRTLASHPELLVVAMHVTPPGATENVIIASNIGRIGKRADAEDRRVIDTGETLAKVNRNGVRSRSELMLHDACGADPGGARCLPTRQAWTPQGSKEGQLRSRMGLACILMAALRLFAPEVTNSFAQFCSFEFRSVHYYPPGAEGG
jgi:hypothetical protein